MYVIQARRHDTTPVLTFDQPLWWKAMTVINDEPKNSALHSIVLRLGGLHLQMSYLGSIGHLMCGSGLEEVIGLIYAENVVPHILSGKAISRALRAHNIVEAALYVLLCSDIFKCKLPSEIGNTMVEQNCADEDHHNELKELWDKASKVLNNLLDDASQFDTLCKSTVLKDVSQKMKQKMESLQGNQTSRLWLQYLNMLSILHAFIKAERTGCWELHLQATQQMLPFFAATGHNLYAKSTYLYLQKMFELETTHPDVHRHFLQGHHVIRRSDRYWAGLSSDLVIEQVLMRGLKTSGGLTRGRGFGEIQRLLWIMSSPSRADMHNAMLMFTEVQHHPSDQHKEVASARQKRDAKDTNFVIHYLSQHNPFSSRSSLTNIANGVVANAKVNVDNAKEIGDKIIKGIAGKTIVSISFKKRDQVTTMRHEAGKSETLVATINPQLLFQRLVALHNKIEDPATLFTYELCTYPTALFDCSQLLRQAVKVELANALWQMIQHEKNVSLSAFMELCMKYVLDGGALLHRVPWVRGQTYEGVMMCYVEYVKKYCKPIVVFDGYRSGPSTKDAAHQRRAANGIGPEVKFTPTMLVNQKKEVFLSNPANKQNFIDQLSERLIKAGCTVIHATSDADLLIVSKAVEMSLHSPTTLVGDDTDLLVLLCYYGDANSHPLYFAPEPKKGSTTKTWNIQYTKKALGPQVCENILFIHALLGCDTTSRVYGIGKSKGLKKFCSSQAFQQCASVFNKINADKKHIIEAGEKAMILLYGGNCESLDQLRYERFCQKVASSPMAIEAKSIPPTSAACKEHVLRVYLQVQEWKGQKLDPCKFGWKKQEDKLQAIPTLKPPAPKELLEVIVCNCKTGCRSMKCTCKKHGLECSLACGICKGVSCDNCHQPEVKDDDDDDGDDDDNDDDFENE